MNYSLIERPDTIGSITMSKLVPNAGYYIATYGDLLKPKECLTLEQFSKRITSHYTSMKAAKDAGILHRWLTCMAYAEHTAINDDCLPTAFEYTDIVYDSEGIALILGGPALQWLNAKTSQAA
ncbi:hypothetical protein AWH63_11030 [Marinobacter sp. C18]|uniref:hypothetical protein n=1 Tax=Marinobacter sp. C18 TaxID=1772288 RepID=UPI000948A15C|nr:hypothetical protein [Marinobacter sp. C18]OLF82065.1 hypothetical protein AWH63_11030 [Marinobacter sp. C18]